MARFKLGPLVKGLSTLVDPAAGDPQAAPELKDVRGHTGILTNRKGFRVLAIEPSHKQTSNDATKAWGYLGFDGVNDYATNAAWTQQLGTKWTIRLWAYALSLSGVNNTTGTRTLIHIVCASQDAVLLQIVGDTGGATARLTCIIKDKDGGTTTLTGNSRTTTQWLTLLGQHAVAYIRVVRDGTNAYLYVGEQLEASSSSVGTKAHQPGVELWVGATGGPGSAPVAGTYCNLQLLGLAVVNRALTQP